MSVVNHETGEIVDLGFERLERSLMTAHHTPSPAPDVPTPSAAPVAPHGHGEPRRGGTYVRGGGRSVSGRSTQAPSADGYSAAHHCTATHTTGRIAWRCVGGTHAAGRHYWVRAER